MDGSVPYPPEPELQEPHKYILLNASPRLLECKCCKGVYLGNTSAECHTCIASPNGTILVPGLLMKVFEEDDEEYIEQTEEEKHMALLALLATMRTKTIVLRCNLYPTKQGTLEGCVVSVLNVKRGVCVVTKNEYGTHLAFKIYEREQFKIK